jgi:hypothetical protein
LTTTFCLTWLQPLRDLTSGFALPKVTGGWLPWLQKSIFSDGFTTHVINSRLLRWHGFVEVEFGRSVELHRIHSFLKMSFRRHFQNLELICSLWFKQEQRNWTEWHFKNFVPQNI